VVTPGPVSHAGSGTVDALDPSAADGASMLLPPHATSVKDAIAAKAHRMHRDTHGDMHRD